MSEPFTVGYSVNVYFAIFILFASWLIQLDCFFTKITWFADIKLSKLAVTYAKPFNNLHTATSLISLSTKKFLAVSLAVFPFKETNYTYE